MKSKKKPKGSMTPPPKRFVVKSKSGQAKKNDSFMQGVLRKAGLSRLW